MIGAYGINFKDKLNFSRVQSHPLSSLWLLLIQIYKLCAVYNFLMEVFIFYKSLNLKWNTVPGWYWNLTPFNDINEFNSSPLSDNGNKIAFRKLALSNVQYVFLFSNAPPVTKITTSGVQCLERTVAQLARRSWRSRSRVLIIKVALFFPLHDAASHKIILTVTVRNANLNSAMFFKCPLSMTCKPFRAHKHFFRLRLCFCAWLTLQENLSTVPIMTLRRWHSVLCVLVKQPHEHRCGV